MTDIGTPKEPCCGTCPYSYWFEYGDPHPPGRGVRSCRRFPPHPEHGFACVDNSLWHGALPVCCGEHPERRVKESG